MSEEIAEIARALAERADSVCRCYLPAGRHEGDQWRVGDVHNAPGRSLYVRLCGPASGRKAAGRWRDSATGEYGDLIDLIQKTRGLSFTEALEEGRRFLRLPQQERSKRASNSGIASGHYEPMTSIRRLLAESVPIDGTLAQAYLRHRGIQTCVDFDALRFHPHCPYRDPSGGQFWCRPAMLAFVTDLDGRVTGIQRTYLLSNGRDKADVPAPRRSLGAIHRHGVRFGVINEVAIFGEGVETVLSLKCVLPNLPVVATLSADNLGAIALPPNLRRLYVAVDPDLAGVRGADALCARAEHAGVRAIRLMPLGEDFNADLTQHGHEALHHRLAAQMTPEGA